MKFLVRAFILFFGVGAGVLFFQNCQNPVAVYNSSVEVPPVAAIPLLPVGFSLTCSPEIPALGGAVLLEPAFYKNRESDAKLKEVDWKTLTYTWSLNSEPLPDQKDISLNISSLSTASEGQYQLVISQDGDKVISNSFLLQNADEAYKLPDTLEIEASPSNKQFLGGEVTFSRKTQGNKVWTHFKYEWVKEGEVIGRDQSLTVANVVEASEGRYTLRMIDPVVGTNPISSNSIELIALDPSTTLPDRVTVSASMPSVVVGGSLTLEAKFPSDLHLTSQNVGTYYDFKWICPQGRPCPSTNSPLAQLTNVAIEDKGNYQVEVSIKNPAAGLTTTARVSEELNISVSASHADCDLDGVKIAYGGKITAYKKNVIPYYPAGQACADTTNAQQRSCGDGPNGSSVLGGDANFKYSSCKTQADVASACLARPGRQLGSSTTGTPYVDVFLLTQNTTYNGAQGDDWYLVDKDLPEGSVAVVQDDSAKTKNVITLKDGLKISAKFSPSSANAPETLEMDISFDSTDANGGSSVKKGGTVKVLNPSKFLFNVGECYVSTSADNGYFSYEDFAKKFGVTNQLTVANTRTAGKGCTPKYTENPDLIYLDDSRVTMVVSGFRGDDTYFLTSKFNGHVINSDLLSVTVSDTLGVETIILDRCLDIEKAQFTPNLVAISLKNGAVFKVLGADIFNFRLLGAKNSQALTFSEFAALFGLTSLPSKAGDIRTVPGFVVE